MSSKMDVEVYGLSKIFIDFFQDEEALTAEFRIRLGLMRVSNLHFAFNFVLFIYK